MNTKKLAKCPSCSIQLDIGKNPRPYSRFSCPDCEAYLEVVRINPPTLDWAFGASEEFYDNLDFAIWKIR